MSDTSIDTTTEPPLVEPGEGFLAFTPAASLPAAPAGEASIGRDEIRSRLTGRLVDLGISESTSRGIAYVIARGLPSTARYESIIDQIDLRPYLQQIGDLVKASVANWETTGNDDAQYQFLSQLTDQIDDLDEAIWDNIIEQTQAGLAAAQQQIVESYASAGVQMPIEAASFSYEVGIDPGVRVLQAGASLATGETTAEQVSAWSVGKSDSMFAAYLNEPVVSIGDIRNQFTLSATMGQPDFGIIQQADSANAQASGTGVADPFPVAVQGSSPTSTPKTMSIGSALLYLTRQSADDVLLIQQQLAAAGYFDVIGETFTPRDAYDDATLKAWRTAVADSITRNVPVMTLLAQQKQHRQATANQRRAAARQAIDARDTEFMLDSWAQETLGHTLTADQKQSLVSYVRNLAGDASQMSWGTNTPAEMQAVSEAGFDQAALGAELERRFQPEVISDRSINFRQFLSSKYELQDFMPEGGITDGTEAE